MIRPFRLSFAILLLTVPFLASCGEAGTSEIAVADAWARASVTETGAAYLRSRIQARRTMCFWKYGRPRPERSRFTT